MKKSLALVLCLSLIMGLAAFNAFADAPKTELKMMIMTGDEEIPGWEAIVNVFNEQNPDCHLTLETANASGTGGWSWDSFNQKLVTLVAAGMQPDIVRNGVAYVPQFSQQGYLLELDELIERDIDKSQYMDGVFDAVRQLDGKIYGLPVGVYTLGLIYNKNMFDAAGVEYPPTDWENPWTLEEFREAAKKLTSGEGPSKKYGYYANLYPERTITFLFGNGTDVLDASHEKCTMDSAGAKAAYRLLQDMTFEDGSSPTATQVRTMPTDQMFISDRLAMMIEGPWMMPAFTNAEGLNFGVAPVPKGLESCTTVNFLDQWCIFKDTPHKEEAWRVLKTFIGYEAACALVDRNVAGIPINLKAIEDKKPGMYPALTEAEKDVWFNSFSYSKPMPFTPTWTQQMVESMKVIDLVSINNLGAEDAMDQVTQIQDEILAKAKAGN